MCYVSWHLANIVLDKFDQVTDKLQTWAVPVLAGLIMVMWDMSMDPARSTLGESWIWRDGGGYFGVPFANFMGWFLCVWTDLSTLCSLSTPTGKRCYVRCKGNDSRIIGTR
ncbi:MAG: carotenoid biosynthesis protein [Caldilineaceae bacterium]